MLGAVMPENLAKAQYYREHAENLRALAAQDDNLQTREALLAVARDYDRLSSKFLSVAGRNQSKTR
jgi:hypothetical protein